MSSPTIKDLPKVPMAMKDELVSFDASKMKHAQTDEKISLPSKEVIQQERVHLDLVTGVEKFDRRSLQHAETQEKGVLPDNEVLQQEKLMKGIEQFDANKLKSTGTDAIEKNPVIEQVKLLKGIETFDSTKLKKAETAEKIILPTKEEIEQEKKSP